MNNNKDKKTDNSQKLKKDISKKSINLRKENYLEQREDPPQKWDRNWEDFLRNNS